MLGARLSDHLPNIANVVTDRLGAPLTYTPSGSAALSLRAIIDYRDLNRDLGGVQAIAQDMTIRVKVSDLPARPIKDDRIVLGALPAKTYAPHSATRTEDGLWWEMALKALPDA